MWVTMGYMVQGINVARGLTLLMYDSFKKILADDLVTDPTTPQVEH